MNKNLQTPTKLTEFAPLNQEDKPQTVSQIFSKFFGFGKIEDTSLKQASPPSVQATLENKEPSPDATNWAMVSSNDIPEGSEPTTYVMNVNEGRSLPNVVRRISNLLARTNPALQDYGDTDLKQYWMPDSVSKECYECCEKFTTFRRKHHCRVCGQIFCSQCCNYHIPGKILKCTGDLRVCNYCCKIILSYLQSSNISDELPNDLKQLLDHLQSKFGESSGGLSLLSPTQSGISKTESSDSLRRKISVGYQEERFGSGSSVSYLSSDEKSKALQQSVSLRNLFEEMCRPVTGIQFDSYKYRLRVYPDCCLGSELVDWLIRQQKAKTRVQASAICQALLEAGYFDSVSEPAQNNFQDGNVRYKKGTVLSSLSPNLSHSSPTFETVSQDEPNWVRQIPHETGSSTDSDIEQVSVGPLLQNFPNSDSYMLDLNLEASTVYISRPSDVDYSAVQSPESPNSDQYSHEAALIRPSEQMEVAPESGWFNAKDLREENGEQEAYNRLSEAYDLHEQSLVKQLLSVKGLSLDWAEILLNLMHDIVAIIRPDKNHDAIEFDIRHYVQFKKLPGGSKTDTQLVSGVVCTKNVAHKEMATDIENPKILLLQCPIVYQRTEGRLMSLEPVMMQESEYLRNVCARISSFQPDVVLVNRNVSRLAQDMLRQNKITLVYNVKQKVLERVARCTEADIVTAVDAHIGRPNLGTCKRFYLKSFNTERGGQKTLMFFEGLPKAWLGSTVLLRGGSKAELARLKQVSSLLLLASYNWRLEKSFLMDEFAMPPNSKCEFLDDSKETSPTCNNSPEKTVANPAVQENKEEKLSITKQDLKIDLKIENPLSDNSKKIVVESIKDFTDPLHSTNYETKSEEVFESNKPNLTVAELYFNSFRKNLDGTILCISPYITFSVPYLETDSGKRCKLRRFFPKNMYYSEQFDGNNKKVKKNLENQKSVDDVESKKSCQPLHPFLTAKITKIDDNNLQNMLAHFRACGGQYEKKETLLVVSQDEEKSTDLETVLEQKDCLDPFNHQRLAVLFCSYSHESRNAPAFCVSPWVVYMEFYGKNDIPLGCFLERYCFKPTYNCPSKSCDTAMVKHVRRFVHSSGCVSIIVNNFDSEILISEEDIAMWSWCTKCQSVSPVVPMSSDTWSYSFAKYLELKFHGDAFSRRGLSPCQHSLHHDHYQYFGYKNYVAFFKYTPISTWEISLPSLLIDLDYTIGNYHADLIDDIRALSQKIHEIFAAIGEKIGTVSADEVEVTSLRQMLSQKQSIFKQKLEDVQVKVTSPTVRNKEFDPKQSYLTHQKIFDNLTRLKFSLVEIIDFWNAKLSELLKKRDTEKSEKKNKDRNSITIPEEEKTSPTSDMIEARDLSIESILSDNQSAEVRLEDNQGELDRVLETQTDDKIDGAKSSNMKETDKKTEKSVMNILDKLLTPAPHASLIQTPFSSQEHYSLPTGVSIPIVVYETEPSSIIAYALNSLEYKKAFEELTTPQGSKKSGSIGGDQTPSPVNKRRGTNSDKEKTDTDEKSSSLFQFLRTRDSKTDLHSPTGSVPGEIDVDFPTTSEKTPDDPKKERKSHIEVQFQDSTCKFYCTVYLADKFAQLRSSILPMGEEGYVRSLCRSVPWKVRGGKSGSNFSKTADGRFVLKEMPKAEVQPFLDFAPNYFVYIDNCATTKQPTILAKIVGIYQITLKNNSNFTFKTDLLVMENLFYNREVEQKFDLKGSMRNRLTVPDNQDGEIVFLDENLLKMTCDNPLYVLPHSKEVLIAAIQNDTEFLSSNSVMDYSIVVGLDIKNKELVLGIIDYIRTFTWDKRLEHHLKKAFSQGKMPTIVSPEEYRKRFIEAMHKYFLEVPDHWAELSK